MRLAYILVGVVLLGELPTMGRRRAEGLRRDRGSYPAITVLMAVGYWGAFYFVGRAQDDPAMGSAYSHWYFGAWSLWAGAILAIGGTAFRQWAIITLGRYFTRSVQVSSDQRVVENGPYRWLRHPSYTGGILAAAGVALALGNEISLVSIMAPTLLGFGYRIHVEEKALLETIGEPYRAYCARTKRLIPFVW